MLSTKRKSNVVIMAILVLLLAVTTIMFCLPNQALAEEAGAQAVGDVSMLATDNSVTSIFIPVAGTFKDGDREYGGFYMNLTANKINSTQYEVTMDISLITTNYITDTYFIEAFNYYFYGTDISLASQGNVEVKLSSNVTSAYDVNNTKYVNYNNKGLGGKKLLFTSPFNKANNYPYIKQSIIINVTGSNPKIGVSVDKLYVIGTFLAKDTKIDTNCIYVETPLTMTSGRVVPVFKYAYKYKNTTFITNGRYTTAGGPVPSYWKKETFSIS